MSNKYGELTIIYNKEETTLFSNLLTWLSYEIAPPTNSNFVFLFEDGEICDTKDKLRDFKFKFFDSCSNRTPRYFEKNIENKDNKEVKNNVYFYKEVTINEYGNPTLNFKNLFASYTKYNSYTRIPSSYNSIYYCYKSYLKPEIFGILRIKSSETMPRFLFAYDSDEFTKEEVIYLINYIFNPLDKENNSKKTT